MTSDRHLTTYEWPDYELLDSGEHEKLERFGEIIVSRPETQAIWSKLKPELWNNTHANFVSKDGKGKWQTNKPVPESWPMTWGNVRFNAKLTGFKHTGVFPEQAPNWEWLSERLQAARKESGRPEGGDPRTFSQEPAIASVLNLFGYTGVATLVAAAVGAKVTHVDASKQSLDWAHDNAKLSQLAEDRIRWMLDEALAFVKREVRREAQYDGIILDPPAFGRGAKGEVWKIEEHLSPLLIELQKLLSPEPGSFFLLNGYASGYSPQSFAQAVSGVFGETNGESGELHIRESGSERVIPAGIYVRFVR